MTDHSHWYSNVKQQVRVMIGCHQLIFVREIIQYIIIFLSKMYQSQMIERLVNCEAIYENSGFFGVNGCRQK